MVDCYLYGKTFAFHRQTAQQIKRKKNIFQIETLTEIKTMPHTISSKMY